MVDAGLTWIGPSPDVIEQMGSKIAARRLASAAGVPIIPGYDESQDRTELEAAAARIGYPVLIKAAAGGGGKGIRIANQPSEFEAALDEATTESERSFGDSAMIVERYIQRPRHVEVQIVGDRLGNVIHLGTRECSVQRRYQKLLEEAPAPNLGEATRHGLRTRAVELAKSIGYDSAGTVEFVIDDTNGDFFFLEMNTRLQVEHPVTEYVTGLDLVELQIRSAAGEALPITQDEVTITGHSIEARINAEDPADGFTPQTGTITHLSVPDDVRWDSGITQGSVISPHYDALVAKLIVGAADRPAALRRLGQALEQIVIGGLVTTAGFHRWLIEQEPIQVGRVTTRFLDETEIPLDADIGEAAAIAARLWVDAQAATASGGPWTTLRDTRLTPHRPSRPTLLQHHSGEVFEVSPDEGANDSGDMASSPSFVGLIGATPAHSVVGRSIAVNMAGATHTFEVLTRTDHWAPSASEGHGHAGAVIAPFPAIVAETPVAPGDRVNGGDTVIVIEAMKMLHSMKAAGPGVIAAIAVAVGDQVASSQVLVTFEPAVTED